MKTNPGVLIIEDKINGKLLEFKGSLFGHLVDPKALSENPDRGYGEIVFNTSMTGYQEILTDPSYYGEIVVMTTPHIGNYGVNLQDEESPHPWCAGFVIHELSIAPSNWRSQGTLEEYLIKHKIPGIMGIDTRALTLVLRQTGVMRGLILSEADQSKATELFKKLPAFEGRDLIQEVTTKKPYRWPLEAKKDEKKNEKKKYHVVALDYGMKTNLLRELELRGAEITVLPATSSGEEILKYKPDGIFLSNGPGDPAAATYAVKAVREVLGKAPLFGVCMGHQILSLAMGGKTYKLKFGHRGGNQPVLDQSTGKVEISSHNHGYSVDAKTLPPEAKVTHLNLNDKTVEGISVPSKQAFSVQYHPEACPGPHDSRALFDRFFESMEKQGR